MAELLIIRHGQAAFGQDDYDVLSDLGHRQAETVGALLRDLDWQPDRLITGAHRPRSPTRSTMRSDLSDPIDPSARQLLHHVVPTVY